MTNFQHNVQFGGVEFDEVCDLGPGNKIQILAAFDKLDWLHEVEKANQTEKCAPTFTVLSEYPKAHIWVSAYADRNGLSFLCDFSIISGEKMSMFGLFVSDNVISPNCRNDMSLDEARIAISHFLDEHHDELIQLISKSWLRSS